MPLFLILLLASAPGWAAKGKPKPPPASMFPPTSQAITLIYPPEGLTMAMAPGEVVFGAVSHPKANFRINGRAVKPHRLGGFIDFVPVQPGTSTIVCELDLPGGTTSLTRTIFVTPPLAPSPAEPVRIDVEARQPASDVELRPGEWLNLQFKGSLAGKAEFAIAGKRRYPMAETNPALGIYQGVYQVKLEDVYEQAEIEFFLKGADGTASAKAKGRLTIRDTPIVAVVRSSAPLAVKTGPGNGYLLFPETNTRFLVAGRQGGETKVQLSPDQSGWIDSNALTFLPPGSLPPRGVLGTVRTTAVPGGTVASLSISEQIPFEVEEAADLRTLTLRLYNAVGYTNWMVYDSTDTFIRQVRWRQEDTHTAVVTFHLDPGHRLWGYHADWEGTSLKLELRHAPPFAPKGESVFKDRVIVVDAGHQPSSHGATGPHGYIEKDANLAIAKAFEKLLAKEGAKVVMTRTGDDEVNLSERPKIAWEKRGELFISVHNNAIGDGEDPYRVPRGFSIYYYHPHSFDFARATHLAYRRRIPLPDEGTRYGNLLVARLTEMPAILVESAYMILPEQEALLASPSFQRRLAGAMLEGARSFLEQAREASSRTPKPPTVTAPPPEPEPAAGASGAPAPADKKPTKRRRKQ
ncbi:MAG: N-acetylmuramoyl-L-alanine amidase [Elusimicrobia bacterium]|nr:N-acetylmuramoyl-L-alanine amidase [Elusimicrobiota bacterium]